MTEREIRKALKKRVEDYGGEIRAVSWLGRRNAPDVLCLFPRDSIYTDYVNRFDGSGAPPNEGEHIFVETKRPEKNATDGQAREHERMREAGCTVLVINTINLLDEWLPPIPPLT